MVTLLSGMQLMKDIGIFETIVPFILITAIVYGLLMKLKPVGDNAAINMTVSVLLGLIFTSFLEAVKFIHYLVPYLIGFFTVIVLIMLIFQFMGAKEETFMKVIMESPSIYLIIIGITVVIVFLALTAAMPQLSTPVNLSWTNLTPSQIGMAQTSSAILHPRMLGVYVILVVLGVVAYMLMPKEKQ